MILIVDDNLPNAELLKLFLERKGNLQCRVSSKPEEILELCDSGQINLVIMDIQLNSTFLDGKPITGIEITQRLKQNPATQNIPVLLATAHAMKEQKEQFLKESGAQAYLIKPFEDYDILIAEIRRWIS